MSSKSISLSAAILATAFAIAFGPLADAAKTPQNLKVYPKNTTLKALKADMKTITKALGVSCDFCHDLDDFAKDTEHKEEAREMMRMTAEINGKHLKKYKDKVTCMTCHRGKEDPDD